MADPDVDPIVPQQRLPTAPPLAVDDATRALLGGVGNAIYGISQLPKQIMNSSEELRAGGDYNPAPMMDMAQLLYGGGMGAAEKGAAGVFGGRLARNADLSNLDLAQAMDAAGHSPEQIHDATKWFKGNDGQWRFEIPDTGANAAYIRGKPMGEPKTLGDTLHHPLLYEAYPDMKHIPVRWDQAPGNGGHSPFTGNESIALSAEDPANVTTPTSLHEAQHAIQWREGFAPGNNVASMQPYAAEALQQHGLLKRVTPTTYQPLAPPGDVAKLLQNSSYEAYKRHAGEVEARNASHRFSNAETGYPWQTEDVPADKQIVRPPFSGSPYGAASSQEFSQPVAQEALHLMPRNLLPKVSPNEALGEGVEGAQRWADALFGHGETNARSFDISNDEGKNIARMWTSQMDPKKVYVNYIASLSPEGVPAGAALGNPGANSIGAKEMRSLINELKGQFPNAESIGGWRISGARAKHGAEGPLEVKLKK